MEIHDLICENMKTIFGYSLTHMSNTADAQDLAGEIILRLLKSSDKLRDPSRFYSFMWRVAENTRADLLRRKSRPHNSPQELEDSLADENDSTLDKIIRTEELNLLRRELSLLSQTCRRVTVMYYMEKRSCSEIAESLEISTEMVKYYLFRARKIIGEGMKMERIYGEKSYRPTHFEIDFFGTRGGDDNEYREFRRRKIKGNILLGAYYTPVTLQELSMELGVSMPYLEDEVKLLCDRRYLCENNGKYTTNIPIFTTECTERINEALNAITFETAERFTSLADKFAERFGDRFADENLIRWQRLLLAVHSSLIETDGDMEKLYGAYPADGAYALVNGGGGSGIVWGRSIDDSEYDAEPQGIQGIYNGCPSDDRRGSVIAVNFVQTLNAQSFEGRMTTPTVACACGCFDYLPDDWKKIMTEQGYVRDGRPNFAVYTAEEYDALNELVRAETALVTELNRRTMDLAAQITAELAPRHIREAAQYVGAFVYRFVTVEKLTDRLYENGWLKAVNDDAKPAMCAVLN